MPMLSPGTVPGHLLSRCPHDPLCGPFCEGLRRPRTHQRDKHWGPCPGGPASLYTRSGPASVVVHGGNSSAHTGSHSLSALRKARAPMRRALLLPVERGGAGKSPSFEARYALQ